MRKGFFRKTLVYMTVLTLLSLVFLFLSTNVIAEDPPEDPEFAWIVDARGNYFEITNSSYLNITMTSSENVDVYIESIPKVVNFHIKRNCMADSTIITLSGFEANKIYYRYQDGHFQENFTTDATGSYSYTQDLTIRHHVSIEETHSTIYIEYDGSISGTTDIQRDGNVYTFLCNIYDIDGIRIYKSDITLDGNGYILEGSGSYGLYLSSRNNVTIKNLYITGYYYGLYCSYSDDVNISDSTFSNNTNYDIRFYRSSNLIVTDNEFSSNCHYGIYLYYCSGTVTIHNNLMANHMYNVYSYDYGGPGPVFTITNNNCQNNSYYGISLYRSSSGATIKDNTIISNNANYGIYCSYCDNIKILNNTISNTSDGICVYGTNSGNIVIVRNTISSGYIGIRCYYANDVTIKENSVINGHYYGFYLYSSTSILATDNTISDNYFGLVISSSNGNTFHHNNIISNTYQVYRYGNPVNTWDDGNGEGNYWSDYQGTDNDNDGIGDTNIPHPDTSHSYGYYQLDYYPLINQWTPINHPPIADAGGPYISDEGYSVTLDATGSYDPDWDNLQYRWDIGNDGWDTSWSVSPKYTDIWGDDTSLTVVVEVSDGEFTSTATSSLTVNNVAPEVSILGGGIGVADNYVFVTDWDSRSYFIEIDEASGELSTSYELVDDKDYRTSGAAVGDFDNDGDFDALYGDRYNTWYYEKIGPGNDFAPAVSIDYGYFNMRCDFAEADFNNDGNLDAIMAYYMATDYFTIYIGNGDGTFTIETLSSPTYYMWGMDAGDFNTDGNMDFVATATYYAGGYIYLGNGDGTFQSPIYIDTGNNYNYGVCAGDFDNDGDDDIIMGYSPVRFYPGDGYGNFGSPINLDFFGVNLAETDIDGDGNLDIVSTDWSNVEYRTGNGDGTFTLISSLYFGGDIRGVATGLTGGGITIDEGYLEEFIGEFSDIGWLDTHTAVWDWGDGSPTDAGTVTEENVEPFATGEATGSHSYGDNGEYTISLTVTDDDGGTTTKTASVTVNNVAPTVDAGSDHNAFVGIPADFSGSFSDPGWLDTHNIEWDWGDGLPIGSGTLTPQHIYSGIGVFTVTLTVTDDEGGVGTDTLTVTVYYPPVADAGIDQTADEGDTVNFDASLSTGSYIIGATYDWIDATILGVIDNTLSTNNDTYVLYDLGFTFNFYGNDYAQVYICTNGFLTFGAGYWEYYNYGATLPSTLVPPNLIAPAFYDLCPYYGGDIYIYQDLTSTPKKFVVEWHECAMYGVTGVNTLEVILYDTGLIKYQYNSSTNGWGPDWAGFYPLTGIQNSDRTVGIEYKDAVDQSLYDGLAIEFYSDTNSYLDSEFFVSNSITSFEWDFDNDGTYDYQETATSAPDGLFDGMTTYTYGDNGAYTVKVQVTDELGATDTDTCLITVNNVAPTITTLTSTLDPVQLGNPISADATFTDPGFLDTHTATIDWGDGNTTVGTITESGGIYTVNTETWIYGNPGVYTITLTVEDDDGGIDTMTFKYVVIYDPSAGFVTGGGWIMSPEGAYAPDPTLTGKANFGFVAKYKKGHSTPDGNTEFQFKVANLNFHSNDYDWLVIQIAGAKAMYKGTGTINGEGNYGFKLTAIDEELTPSTSVDMFRIKIWDKDNNDEIIYDNQLGDEDDADPSTPISGGNIRIHEG